MSEKIAEMTDEFVSKEPKLSLRGPKIWVDGVYYTKKQFSNYLISKDFFKKYNMDISNGDEFSEAMWAHLLRERVTAPATPFGPHNCRLFKAINEGNEKAPQYALLEDIGRDRWAICEDATADAILSDITDKHEKAEFLANAVRGHIYYKPHESSTGRIIKEKTGVNGVEFYKLNTYCRPYFLRDWDKKTIPEIPALLDKYFSHLFLHPIDKEICYEKLHHMATGKSLTWFLLISRTKGVGKSLLKKIVTPLFGERNVGNLPRLFFKGAFDAVLRDKTLICGDEISAVSDEQMDNVKRLIEAELNIHSKHINAVKSFPNYANFIFTNNSPSAFKIDFNERRFWIPDIREMRLEDAFTEEEQDIIWNLKEDSPMIVDFCRAIYKRRPKFDKDSKLLAYSRTHQLCVTSSLAIYEKDIVEKVLRGQTIDIESYVKKEKRAIRATGGKIPTIERVESFVENYRHILAFRQPPKRIARIERTAEGTKIVPNNYIFDKTKTEELESNETDSSKKEEQRSNTNGTNETNAPPNAPNTPKSETNNVQAKRKTAGNPIAHTHTGGSL